MHGPTPPPLIPYPAARRSARVNLTTQAADIARDHNVRPSTTSQLAVKDPRFNMILPAATPATVTRVYGTIDYALDLIRSKQVAFVHVSLLNDPFDPYCFFRKFRRSDYPRRSIRRTLLPRPTKRAEA